MAQPFSLKTNIRPRGDVTIGTRRPLPPSITAGDLASATANSALEDFISGVVQPGLRGVASGAEWVDDRYREYVPREIREMIEMPDPGGNIDALIAKAPASLAKAASKGSQLLSNMDMLRDVAPVAGMTLTPRTFPKFKGLYIKLMDRFNEAAEKGLPVTLPTGTIEVADLPPEEIEKLAFGITRFPTSTMRFPMQIESLPGKTAGTFYNATASSSPSISLDPDKADFLDSFLHEAGGHGIDWLRYPTQHKATRITNISKRDPSLVEQVGKKQLFDNYWNDPGEQTAREVGMQALTQMEYYKDLEKKLASLGLPSYGNSVSDEELDMFLNQAYQRAQRVLSHGRGRMELLPLPGGEAEPYFPSGRVRTKGQKISKRKRDQS